MLKLTRRIGESIRIGDQIVVTIISRGKLPGEFKVGISAPESVRVRRAEITPRTADCAPRS